jgi:CRISPR/Cas system-associated exonuclease Cas4 (RecB family)
MPNKKTKKLPIKLNQPQIKTIDFTSQRVVSFSQYQTFAQCPHKWYLQSVKKLKSPPNINMVFGTAMHHTIQHYLKVMYATSGAAADREDLIQIFEEKFKQEYAEQRKINKDQHFSTPEEFNEYYEDGLAIIDWFRKNRRKFFSTKDEFLVGIEMPIQKEVSPGIIFNGFIDVVIYDQVLDVITVYDLKTSTKGWGKWQKEDFDKTMQVLLYKLYFAELYNFPIEKIRVEFLILKRKAEPNEFREFPPRIQSFKPTAGKILLKKTNERFDYFVTSCFQDGKLKETYFAKQPSKLCDYCQFNNTENCIK